MNITALEKASAKPKRQRVNEFPVETIPRLEYAFTEGKTDKRKSTAERISAGLLILFLYAISLAAIVVSALHMFGRL
jgi:hypothetical protein